ncbi:MAG: hypothetical protein R2710_31165, partial [Acidimicrobiales bacterium]
MSTWTDHLDLITVGEPLGDISGSQRVRHFADAAEAVGHIELIATSTGEQLDAAGFASTVEARVADDHGDGWIPTILLASAPLDSDLVDRLASAIKSGRGVGAVVPGPIPTAGWHALLDGPTLQLLPHNLQLTAVSLDAETTGDLDQILTDLAFDQPCGDEVLALPEDSADDLPDAIDDSHADDDAVAEDLTPFVEATAEVEFRVL